MITISARALKEANVVTYTVGFALDESDPITVKAYDLLQRTANEGRGRFFIAQSGAGLADAFTTILNEILAKTSSFVAPIVPVSRLEKTTAGDKIYLAFFKPASTGMWSGTSRNTGSPKMTQGILK
jgi:type IV pilus assembly protein PilY1